MAMPPPSHSDTMPPPPPLPGISIASVRPAAGDTQPPGGHTPPTLPPGRGSS
jgi:hypothetical protein